MKAGNPLALGLVIVGAVGMALAAFLPLNEPTGPFRLVQNNTLIQHGGWLLIAVALGIAASGFRASQKPDLWAAPLVLCDLAAIGVILVATDTEMRTLYPIGVDGSPDTSQPGMVAILGIAVYVAGAGVAVAAIGSLMFRQGRQRYPDALEVAAAVAATAPTKKCPDCAETVLADAKVCKHCTYRFVPATGERAESKPTLPARRPPPKQQTTEGKPRAKPNNGEPTATR
jgi:hypothetical protein